MSSSFDTWMSCWRRGFTTVFSSSRAEVFSAVTCTVISGMAMSGSNETGNVTYVTTPSMKQTVKAISTAMGRCIRNFIMDGNEWSMIND